MKVGFLHSLVRKEEKLLITEFSKRPNVELVMLDDRELQFDLKSRPGVDVVIERSINHSRALHALRLFQSVGVPCVKRMRCAKTGASLMGLTIMPGRPQNKLDRTEKSKPTKKYATRGGVSRSCPAMS